MSPTLWMVNPGAGSGRAARIWRELVEEHPRLGSAPLIWATDPETASRELDVGLAEPVDRLVVLGGDGTVHLAVNSLLEAGRADRVALGVLPAGTGSDLARSLGLPRDPRAAYRRLEAATPRPIDALEISTEDRRPRYAVNVASAGVSGLVDEKVSAMPRRGKTSFLRATLAALWQYEPVPCRVWLESDLWFEGPVLLLAVANGAYFGKGMRVAPQARLDDGLADVVLVTGTRRWKLVFRLPRIYLGTHLGSRFVRWCQARRIRLEPLAPLPPFDLDGEVAHSAGATFAVLPGALRILA